MGLSAAAKGQRGDGESEDANLRQNGCLRNEQADETGVNRAAERTENVLQSRAKGASDAELSNDRCGKHNPQTMKRKRE